MNFSTPWNHRKTFRFPMILRGRGEKLINSPNTNKARLSYKVVFFWMRINLSSSHISWRTTYSNQVKGKTTYSNQVKGKKRWHHLLHADVISLKSLILRKKTVSSERFEEISKISGKLWLMITSKASLASLENTILEKP